MKCACYRSFMILFAAGPDIRSSDFSRWALRLEYFRERSSIDYLQCSIVLSNLENC